VDTLILRRREQWVTTYVVEAETLDDVMAALATATPVAEETAVLEVLDVTSLPGAWPEWSAEAGEDLGARRMVPVADGLLVDACAEVTAVPSTEAYAHPEPADGPLARARRRHHAPPRPAAPPYVTYATGPFEQLAVSRR
jgi:hypothetical protein